MRGSPSITYSEMPSSSVFLALLSRILFIVQRFLPPEMSAFRLVERRERKGKQKGGREKRREGGE